MDLLAPRICSFIESGRLPNFELATGCFRTAIGLFGSVVARCLFGPAKSATNSAARANSLARNGWPIRPSSHELQGF